MVSLRQVWLPRALRRRYVASSLSRLKLLLTWKQVLLPMEGWVSGVRTLAPRRSSTPPSECCVNCCFVTSTTNFLPLPLPYFLLRAHHRVEPSSA